VRDGVVGERVFGDAVRVAIERKETAFLEGNRGKLVVDVLPMPIAVDLDRNVPLRRLLEHPAPVRRNARPGVEHPPLRVSEDRDTRQFDRGEHSRGLIGILPQLRMR